MLMYMYKTTCQIYITKYNNRLSERMLFVILFRLNIDPEVDIGGHFLHIPAPHIVHPDWYLELIVQ